MYCNFKRCRTININGFFFPGMGWGVQGRTRSDDGHFFFFFFLSKTYFNFVTLPETHINFPLLYFGHFMNFILFYNYIIQSLCVLKNKGFDIYSYSMLYFNLQFKHQPEINTKWIWLYLTNKLCLIVLIYNLLYKSAIKKTKKISVRYY